VNEFFGFTASLVGKLEAYEKGASLVQV